MFIALYFIIANLALPSVETTMSEIASTIAIAIIIIIVLKIVLELIGIQTSGKVSGMVIVEIVKAIIDLLKKIVKAIGWVVRKAVEATPKIYNNSKSFYSARGLSNTASTALAMLTAGVFIAIII